MDIKLCVSELLQTHNQIGVVGLGTFFKEKIAGKYDTAKNAFVPPTYVLSFTTELLEQTLLANYIVEKKDITHERALFDIEEFAKETQITLAENKELTLNPIGKLTLLDQKVIFTPQLTSIAETSFFGFPELPEKEENHKTPEITEEKINHPELIEEPTQTEESEITLEEDELEAKKSTPIFTWLLIVLLSLSCLVGITYFIKPSLFDGLTKKNIDPNEPKISTINTNDITKLDTAKIAPDTATTKTTLEVDTNSTIDSSKITIYEVIASAEKSEKRIKAFTAHMAKKGITVKALPKLTGRSMIKLSVGTFIDFNAAKKHQDSLRIKLNNPEIYIQQIKPKK